MSMFVLPCLLYWFSQTECYLYYNPPTPKKVFRLNLLFVLIFFFLFFSFFFPPKRWQLPAFNTARMGFPSHFTEIKADCKVKVTDRSVFNTGYQKCHKYFTAAFDTAPVHHLSIQHRSCSLSVEAVNHYGIVTVPGKRTSKKS